MLNSNAIDISVVTEEQKQLLRQWCEKNIKQIDFTTAIEYKDDGSFTTNWNAVMLSAFIVLFDFPVDKKVYESMIYFGWNESNKDLGTMSFVKAKMTKAEFNTAVVNAVNSNKMKKMVLEERIKYCAENKLDGILDYMIKMLENYNEDSRYYYYVAIDYFEAISHLDDALHFFDKFNTELKIRLVGACIKAENQAIIPLLEKEIEKDNEESIVFASLALELKNETGINYYTEWVEKNKKTFTRSHVGINFKSLNSVDDLDALFKLLKLSYKYPPNDSFDRITGNINEAILAIGLLSLENIKIMIAKQQEFIANNSDLNNVNYQHYYIDIALKRFLDSCIYV